MAAHRSPHAERSRDAGQFFLPFSPSIIVSSATGTDQSDPSFAISPIRLGNANRIFPSLPFLSDFIASSIDRAEHAAGTSIGSAAVFSASSILDTVPG